MIAAAINLTPSLLELTDELERLRQFGSRIGLRLVKASEVMQASGLPPSVELLEELQAYRNRLHRLAHLLLTDAQGNQVDDGNTPQADAGEQLLKREISFDRMQEMLQSRQRISDAEGVRLQLSQLTHVDVPDFAPLALCLRESSRLCELAKQTTEGDEDGELKLLGQRRHPLNALLCLAEDGDQLSDLEWTEHYDNVTATYGRQLATALTRGRIRRVVINPNDAPAQPPNHPAKQPVSAGVTTVVASESIFEAPAQYQTTFEAPVAPPTSATRGRSSAPTSLNSGELLNRTELPVPPLVVFSAATTLVKPVLVPNMPRAAMEQSGSRADRISGQIIRLMTEDRLPLALQLTRCLELRPEPSTWLPPPWLLRALILGRHLSYSKGEIARQLGDELRNFRIDVLTEANTDRQTAMGFLLRAAAIPAALLAGSTTATSILRAFKIAPGFGQIYNYCSRIAQYGDRLGGSLVEMFRPSGTIAGASELEDLTVTAQDWLQTAAKKAVAYSRTSPLFLHAHWTLTAGTAIRHAAAAQLWCQWQETLLLAQWLLKPVCQGLDGERNWVRQEIVRLTAQMRAASQDPATGSQSSAATEGRGSSQPVEEMHSMLIEAIGIANRWLRLCNQADPGGASPVPLEALELRDEILQRSDAVMNELIQHRKQADSPLVKAAIACCQATVRQIQAMFESKLSLPVMEPDSRHVLQADLLRIPGLELNDQWVPDCEPALFERDLLANLESGELNWLQSFEFHARDGNHEATGMLLELDVWENGEERGALRAIRDAQIADNRAMLESELHELVTKITQTSEPDGYLQSDRLAYTRCLDALRFELPRVQNFSAFRRRLSQLQATFDRRRLPQPEPNRQSAQSLGLTPANRRMEMVGYGATGELAFTSSNSRHQESDFHSADIFSGE